MKYCKVCGFPLGTRPGLLEVDGVCGACINAETKKTIDFAERQAWLTEFIAESKNDSLYDCVVAVSGGKDSHMIVKRLFENHGIKNALLVSVTDEFTHTKAGQANINNLVTRYNCDHITFRCKPKDFVKHTLHDFETELHPLKWIEAKIYEIPVQIAKAYNIPMVFFGENSAFEYGTCTELKILHPDSVWPNIIFMGAIYPYSVTDSFEQASLVGFKGLDDFGEWPREGSIDQITQIDSIGYIIQLWTKYVKFGFQRVADMACRCVREGNMTRKEARDTIDDKDYICDPMAKIDFCRAIGISETYFDEAVARHANLDVVEYRDGQWRARQV